MIPDTKFDVDVAGQVMEDIPICALLDGRFRTRLKEIIDGHGITLVVETGIDRGGSTMLFSKMVQSVVGVDNDASKIDAVQAQLNERGIENVGLLHMNSPDALQLLAASTNLSKTLFLLDAHWQTYWPLRDEIKAIPRGQGILVMHDARVPGCPTLGVDAYDGQELCYEYLQDVLTEWSPRHAVEYNDETAEFPHRGVMIVYPEGIQVSEAEKNGTPPPLPHDGTRSWWSAYLGPCICDVCVQARGEGR